MQGDNNPNQGQQQQRRPYSAQQQQQYHDQYPRGESETEVAHTNYYNSNPQTTNGGNK